MARPRDVANAVCSSPGPACRIPGCAGGTGIGCEGCAPRVDAAAISLRGDPRHLEAGLTKIKLFFESADETRYAELYADIDLGATKLYVNEKDPGYRPAVVRALSAP